MLGSEYNWLISHSRPAHGVPQVRVASGGLLTIAVAMFCFLCVALRAESAHRVLLQEALAANKAGDLVLTIKKLELARALRPDYPRVVLNLARIYAAANRADASVAAFRSLADKGRAELVAYDLASGKLVRRVVLPVSDRGRALGSLVVASDGTVYATDSTTPALWRVAPGADQAEEFVAHPDFVSLQGLDFIDDGRALIVADYGNGLWRVDLATRTTRLLPPPAQATLFGIDGLVAVPGGLIAVQNGIAPQRVVRIYLGPDARPAAVKVLEAAHSSMADPTLGIMVNGEFVFIANAGWELFGQPDARPEPRAVPVFHTVIN